MTQEAEDSGQEMEVLEPTGVHRPRWDAAILHLLQGKNDKQTGAAVGATQNTIWVWRHNPEFQARYQELRELAFQRVAGRSADWAEAGMEGLLDLAKNAEKEEVQLAANKALVENALKLNTEDVKRALDALREMLQ